MTVIYEPSPAGSWAPRPKGHAHALRPICYTLEGPLKVLMGCAYCSKTYTAVPNPRLIKIPEGFNAASWAKFLKRGAEREAQMRLEAQERSHG